MKNFRNNYSYWFIKVKIASRIDFSFHKLIFLRKETNQGNYIYIECNIFIKVKNTPKLDSPKSSLVTLLARWQFRKMPV